MVKELQPSHIVVTAVFWVGSARFSAETGRKKDFGDRSHAESHMDVGPPAKQQHETPEF